MTPANSAARMVHLSLLLSLVVSGIPGTVPVLEARQGNKTSKTKQPAVAAADLAPVWPLPPEAPRIRYVRSYYGADDFKTRKTPRWKTLLLGDDPSDRKSSDSMVKPYGIAVSRVGRVYVTDTVARRVFVFDPEAKTVTFLGEKGTARLTKPVGVAVDADDNVFVADASANRDFRR